MPKVLGIIPARYWSSRFPGKALCNVGGRSMIHRTFEAANKSNLIDMLLIATDDVLIYNHVKTFTDNVVMTSRFCVDGTDRIVQCLQLFALDEYRYVVNIQGDEPLINGNHIDKAITCLINNQTEKDIVMSTLACPLKHNLESPDVVKVVFNKYQEALYFSRSLIPYNSSSSCRANYYKHIGLYVYQYDFLFNKFKTLSESELQQLENLEQLKVLDNGYNIMVELVEDYNIGIDTPHDLIQIQKSLTLA